MPPLKDTLRNDSPKGFVAVDNPNPPSSPVREPGAALGGNPYLRCPLPPFNATSDTLRQFNEGGKIPARRVIPLPVPTSAGGTVNQTTNTTIIQQGGGGGGGGGSTTLTSKTVTVNVPALVVGAQFLATVAMAKSFQLLQVTSSNPIEVRVYGDATTQTSDLARATDVPPPFETTPGLISDVVLDTSPFQWNWQNRIGANASSPQTTQIFLTFVGVSGISGATVTITYLPLES
jgi:hypothetical protein